MTASTIEISVRPDINEVSRTSRILSDFWVQHRLPPEAEMDASLALEELLSNVIRHGCGPPSECDIRVRISLLNGAYEIEVSDDAAPFNPLLYPPPNLDVPLAERTPGGLGIFLVKQLADDLHYEFRDGRNLVTFRKSLPR